jgi:tetratricopeptide (TPR) repeat protein
MTQYSRPTKTPKRLAATIGLCSLALLANACGSAAEESARSATAPTDLEPIPSIEPVLPVEGAVISLLGQPLLPAALPEEVRTDLEAKLAIAKAEYEADPENSDAIIWLGRRLAYLGHYQEAIAIFTQGIELHPNDARFYRHRGHRYITTRRLDSASADFEIAAELIEGTEDRVEPDGLPNDRGIPTSTLQSNIWYHLGLARYLQGDFEGALSAYRECLKVSNNPDMLVATSHWLYMTLRRLGRAAEATAVLEPITADLDVIENGDYHRLLLLYRGDLTEADVAGAESDGPGSAAAVYGIGNWHLYEGRPDRAEEIFAELLETDQWAAFGYIAAEAEVARTEAVKQ